MSKRPELNRQLNGQTFQDYYYLKEELVEFCRNNQLPITGSKIEITNRIAHFLNTGKIIKDTHKSKRVVNIDVLTLDTLIEPDFICSEKHRTFFKEQIGKNFSFNVLFQKWLKTHDGFTYKEAVDAYYQILEEKKKGKTTIDKQFEYNRYIRDFFADNIGKSLDQAIICWKYKKSLKGNNRYEKEDLIALS